VTYPDNVPAHTKVQKLYFGDDFMLRRLDYTTDVLGGVAAHYCYDLVTIDGLVFPTLRRVVRRTPEGPSCQGVRRSFSITPTWRSANDLEDKRGFNPDPDEDGSLAVRVDGDPHKDPLLLTLCDER